MDNDTPSITTPPVEVDQTPQQVEEVALPATQQEEPKQSWQTVIERARVSDPALADDIAKLHGAASNEAGALSRRLKELPTDDPFTSPIMRRMVGLEDGDPYEGMETKDPDRPDFAKLIGEIPDEALTDRAAMQAALVGAVEKLWEAVIPAARGITRETYAQTTRATAQPVLESIRARQEEAQIRQAEIRVSKLPGMAEETARNLIYDAMAQLDRRGEQGFAATYMEMIDNHPEWAASSRSVSTPEATSPTAAPMSDADRMAVGFLGVNAVNGGGLPSILPRGLDPTERTRAMARTPEMRALFKDGHVPSPAEFREVKQRLGG